MAYFPNGTAGELFELQECRGCVHSTTEPEAVGCPVMMVHMLFNYDQNSNADLNTVLLTLIDDENEPLGQMCSMRIPRDNPTGDALADAAREGA